MVKGEDTTPTTSQGKKKRIEEEPMSPDAGARPIQLQRRRVWRACESCRRKKIKCDGCEPTCSQCSASGSQCTWLQTKDRAALSRHYVQELEARLLHMESLFQQIAPTLQTGEAANGLGPLPAGITSSVDPSTPVTTTTTTNIAPPSTHVDADSTIDDDFSESFGQLALDEYGHMRWIGGSSTMSLIQSFKALTTSPLHRISPMEEDPQAPGPSVNKLYFPAAIFFGKVDALPGPEEVEYPERDLADRLVDAYFSRLHYLMPVIDKPTFLAKYKLLMDNTSNPTWARTETPFLSLVFSVFACAASLVQDPRLAVSGRDDDGGMGMVYYERALILQYISHANIQMAHVQCFILMSSFLCSINCLPQAWILIGQAVRNGQDLGLHRSPRRLNVPNIEKETRRKVWWGVYTLDRMLALALGRPLGINDTDCDVELPVDVEDEDLADYYGGAQVTQPSLMAGFIYMIKLYEIGGRMLRQVYALDVCRDHLEPDRKAELQRTVENLDNELTKWCNELPAVYKTQPQKDEQASMGIVLCSHYYSLVTTLHRNFLPVKRDDSVTAKSTLKAVSTARHCIKLAPSFQTLVAPSHHLAFFIQNLFSSAVIVLLFSMHTTDTRAAAVTLDEAKGTLSALEAWEGQWPGARKCKELLIELVNTATEAIARHQKDANVNGPPPASPPSRHERRRSVTIGTTTSSVPSGRGVKTSRTRRNQSRDPGTTSSRRMAAVSPYPSRQRPYDDTESGERSAGPLYQSFPTVIDQNGPSSTQQSPPQQQQPPSEPTSSLANAYTYQSPISPTQPSPPHMAYDYNNYGVQPSSLSQDSTQQWATNGSEYTSPSQDQTLYTSPYGYGSLDGGFGAGLSALSTTSPFSNFAASGLPFRGLDYIRNFSTGGYSTDQDSLWQSYDLGSFGYDPDLAFNLADASTVIQDNGR
ncbi:fungal-specific transcription factor domain-containing protein [Ephemerocybe angulata]|uniref:Fungal-specific transcription factor domain-containing protein n=1 Tax=Ephemerocybe angulata TaxID=980116 RepID=A0A8H6IC08_9AGAR|nr:fungal-specific transcription factor domain-containing protein [Tulosesus angulatus]